MSNKFEVKGRSVNIQDDEGNILNPIVRIETVKSDKYIVSKFVDNIPCMRDNGEKFTKPTKKEILEDIQIELQNKKIDVKSIDSILPDIIEGDIYLSGQSIVNPVDNKSLTESMNEILYALDNVSEEIEKILNSTSYTELKTTSKTIPGAICELNEKIESMRNI